MFLVGTAQIGGTERFVAQLAGRLDRRSFLSAICVVDGPGPMTADYERAVGSVSYLHWHSDGAAPAVADWQHLVRTWHPDLLVLCGFRANMIGRLLSGRVPVVNALRSVVLDDTGRPLAHLLDRITFGRVAVCVANSQAAIDRHVSSGFPADRFEYLPNGVDLERFSAGSRDDTRAAAGLASSELLLLAVANLRPVKNLPLLLRASRRLLERGLTHRVWVVGEGDERRMLEGLSRELGLNSTVRFLGAVPDLPARYAAADAFVLTSQFEGMPTVVLEAFAAGLPVVATAVGDVPTLCRDTGLLVPPDDLDALVDALTRVLRDGALREMLSRSAKDVSQRYSIERMIRSYAEIFMRASLRERVAPPRPAGSAA